MMRNALSKYFFKSDLLLLTGGLGFLLLAGAINVRTEKPIIKLTKQDTALNINHDLVRLLSAGNKRLLTDLLWIQTLIESDLEHYNNRDLNNWLFLRFNTIATLDPNFYENYLYGGLFLGVAKDDLEGADVLYTKGLKVFPDDYRLNYNAGFLRYFELGKMEAALVSLKKIRNNPRAPVFINSIINKLMLATGTGLEEVFGLVLFNYNSTEDKYLKEKLRRDLYSIRAEIDLSCLNNQGTECALGDLDGKPYTKKNGSWNSAKPFLPYRLNRRSTTQERLQETNTFK